MKSWKVLVTPEAGNEIREIHSYITNYLFEPQAASEQVKRILTAVESLKDMPLRFPLYEKEPWQSRSLRKMVVDKYFVFYLPNEPANEIIIAHIFYSGRNIDEAI